MGCQDFIFLIFLGCQLTFAFFDDTDNLVFCKRRESLEQFGGTFKHRQTIVFLYLLLCAMQCYDLSSSRLMEIFSISLGSPVCLPINVLNTPLLKLIQFP